MNAFIRVLLCAVVVGFLQPRANGSRKCVVVDESKTGARLTVNAPNEDNCYIYMSLESTSRHHCRVSWRSDKQIGVEFLD
jgi:hypothetical protein